MVRLRFSEILVKFAILVTVLIVISVTVAADFMQYPDKPLEKSGGSGNFNDGRYTNYMKNGNAISGVNRCVNGYCGPETGHAIYGENRCINGYCDPESGHAIYGENRCINGYCGQENGQATKFRTHSEFREEENILHTKNREENREGEMRSTGIGINGGEMYYKARAQIL
jgi:hypothetical protein